MRLLKKIGFDTALQAEAIRLCDATEPPTVKAELDRQKKETMEIRNRAYAHLKEAVDRVREYGVFVIQDDEKRFVEYRRQYRRTFNRPYRGKKNKNLAEPVTSSWSAPFL